MLQFLLHCSWLTFNKTISKGNTPQNKLIKRIPELRVLKLRLLFIVSVLPVNFDSISRHSFYQLDVVQHLETRTKNMNGEESVKAWIDGIKPEHGIMAQRVDSLIKDLIPEIQCTTKWHKPSQPLGVPFYGLFDKGWIIAMWSFKNEFALGFIAGTLLNPEPPVTKMSGPWNRNSEFQARRIDIKSETEFDEKLIRSWIEQASKLPGWGKIEN